MAKPQYGYQHRLERAAWNNRLTTLGPIPCRRCGLLVYCDAMKHLNRDGSKFQLGHGIAHAEGGAGNDKQPEHSYCNEAAGGRLGKSRTRAQKVRASRHWR